jgi:SAM-dependent methyltransferase
MANEQAQLWNGAAGCAWVDAQESIDRMFKPVEDLLIDAVAARSPRTLLDIGCGTGATTVAAARRLGATAACTGVDISATMIAAARARAQRERLPVDFIVADAETHRFEAASIDAVISRFGVMFFADPVRAFANLRSAAAGRATLQCVAWRSPDQNPFMTAAERAAAPLLPALPARTPDGPGQFAFADDRRVLAILQQAGWSDIALQPIDVPCVLPEPDLLTYLTRFGPVGRALDEIADTDTRTRVVDVVRAAFEPYVHGPEVRFTAACWMITARADANGRPV